MGITFHINRMYSFHVIIFTCFTFEGFVTISAFSGGSNEVYISLGHLLINAEMCILLNFDDFDDFQSSTTSLCAVLATLLRELCDVIYNIISMSKDILLYE